MKMIARNMVWCLVLSCGMLLIPGCNGEREPIETENDWRTGTVTYVDLEGGFFGIIGDDAERYDPINLDNAFKEEGLRIRFQFDEVTDRAGIRMWGTMVELRNVERE